MDFKSYLEKKNFVISHGEDKVPFTFSIHYEHTADYKLGTFQNISQGDMRRIREMDEYLTEHEISPEEFFEMLKNLPDSRFKVLLQNYENGYKKAVEDLKFHGSLHFVEKYNQHQNKTKKLNKFSDWLEENNIQIKEDNRPLVKYYENLYGEKQKIEYKFVTKTEYQQIFVMFNYFNENKNLDANEFLTELKSNEDLNGYLKVLTDYSNPKSSIKYLQNNNPITFVKSLNQRREFKHIVETDKVLKTNRTYLSDRSK